MPRIDSNRVKARLTSCLFSLLLALAFMLVFAECNTPLGPSIGSDNAIYLTMGTALSRGYAPYTEVFDHKGPLLFLLQLLPQALAGGYSTLAVFVQEVVFLFACLRVTAAIARRMDAPAWAAQLGYLALFGPLLSGGNLTEEYANLFTLGGLYLALRSFDREEPHCARLPAAALGALAMLAFLTRANNALCLLAMTAGLALWLLVTRRFAALGNCALGFSLGAAVTLLPVALWLAANGALSASVYGSLIHNMMYSETDGSSRVTMLFCSSYGHKAMLMAGIACLGALAAWRRTRRAAFPLSLVLAAAGAGLSAFISHKFYLHYLMVLAPAATTGLCALLAWPAHASRQRSALACAAAAVCAAVLLLSGAEANDRRLADRETLDAYAADAQALYAQVPEAERDQFMAYRVEPKWYAVTGALPCMRFYFLQEILAQADPQVMDEIVETFETDPPKWLVIFYNREFGPPYDDRVAEIFAEEYEFVDAQGEYQLLRHREDYP